MTYLRAIAQGLGPDDFFLMLSSKSFIVSCFTLKSVMCFKLIFVLDVRFRSKYFCFFGFFAYRYPIVPAPFVENTIYPSLNCFCIFVKNGKCWGNFWVFYSVPLISVSWSLRVRKKDSRVRVRLPGPLASPRNGCGPQSWVQHPMGDCPAREHV